MEGLENLELSQNDGILTIAINRPNKLNALNIATVEELKLAIQHVYDTIDVRGVIILGNGEKAFVAGADIKEISELTDVNGRKFAENGQEVFELIEKCNKPIIAAIDGFALGGGCELAMACHMRIATAKSKFGQPEVSLGIIPGYGGTQRLPQLVGKGKALELMMTGDMLGAHDAAQIGLINHVVSDRDELLAKCQEIFEKIAKKAPLAIGMIIDCVNAYYAQDENGFQQEANCFANCCKSEDFKEGTAAFLEKRVPSFKGV